MTSNTPWHYCVIESLYYASKLFFDILSYSEALVTGLRWYRSSTMDHPEDALTTQWIIQKMSSQHTISLWFYHSFHGYTDSPLKMSLFVNIDITSFKYLQVVENIFNIHDVHSFKRSQRFVEVDFRLGDSFRPKRHIYHVTNFIII